MMLQLGNMKVNNPNLDIIYEDENYVFINKPAGLLSIPDRYNINLINLRTTLENKYGEIFVVHRLDRDTSGAIMFAKNAEAHKFANDSFENQSIKRIYHVIVRGMFPADELEIDIPLLTDSSERGRVVPSARGKYSLTKVRLLQKFRLATLLECELVTGRQHQIRVHLAAIGHPLLIDGVYGDSSEFYLSRIKKNYNADKNIEEKPIFNRLSMHAYSLIFDDIFTNKEINVSAHYPKDFEILTKQLKKYSKFSTL